MEDKIKLKTKKLLFQKPHKKCSKTKHKTVAIKHG